MNKATLSFFENLKNDPEVLGVILFGSWARGDNRENSDVDLIVIKNSGFLRTVEIFEGQAFEITYTTPISAMEYWKTNKDDAYGLWSVAKVIFDRDGQIENLKTEIQSELSKGKASLSDITKQHLFFDAEDTLDAVRKLEEIDNATAALVLYNKVFQVSEWYFDLRQLWTPAPKQIVKEFKRIDPVIHELLLGFYSEGKSLKEKIKIADNFFHKVFQKYFQSLTTFRF